MIEQEEQFQELILKFEPAFRCLLCSTLLFESHYLSGLTSVENKKKLVRKLVALT
jgi:hypothetical protein